MKVKLLSLLLVPYIALLFLESWPRENRLNDMGIFLTSGQLARTNPYNVGEFPNFNPPISLLIFEPISSITPIKVLTFWYITSLLIYLIVLYLIIRHEPKAVNKCLWALSLTGLWTTLSQGQIYIPMVFLSVIIWLSLERKQKVLPGILIGIIIALKPNFLIWSLFLFVGGYSLTAIVSLFSAALISLVPIFVYGTAVYKQWLNSNGALLEMLDKPANSSLLGLAARLSALETGVIIGGIIVGGLVYYIWRVKPEVIDTSNLGIITSLLISPIAWPGYWLLLLPMFMLKKWTLGLTLAAVLMIVPILFFQSFIFSDPLIYKTIGSFYSITLLIIFIDRIFTSLHYKDYQLN